MELLKKKLKKQQKKYNNFNFSHIFIYFLYKKIDI